MARNYVWLETNRLLHIPYTHNLHTSGGQHWCVNLAFSRTIFE
jgi:hypothetical protein